MDDKNQRESVHNYEILRSVSFENNQGFALAKNPDAPDPYVTWQFTEEENGTRDYYWGRYVSSKDTATRDYENRIADFMLDHDFSDKGAYKYYSTQRPVDIATYPQTENGPVYIKNYDKRESVESGKFQAWGYLIYDAPLTEKLIKDFELRAAHDNLNIKADIREQVQIVGIWEDERRMPEDERFTWHKPSIQGFALREPAVAPEQLERRYTRAFRELTASERRNPPKSIAEQLAEAAEMVERGESIKTDKKQNKSHEDR